MGELADKLFGAPDQAPTEAPETTPKLSDMFEAPPVEGEEPGHPYIRAATGAALNIASGASSFMGRVLPGAGGQALSDAGPLVARGAQAVEPQPAEGFGADVARGFGSLPMAGLAAFAEAEQGFQEAKRLGKTDEEAKRIGATVGVVNGALELVPLFRAGKRLRDIPGVEDAASTGARRVFDAVRNFVTRTAKQGAQEAPTEALQEIVQNAVTVAYDAEDDSFDRKTFNKLTEGALRSAAVGAVVGGTVGAVTPSGVLAETTTQEPPVGGPTPVQEATGTEEGATGSTEAEADTGRAPAYLWTLEEIEQELESAQADDASILNEVFGEEGARRYSRLDRLANSVSAHPDRISAAAQAIAEMEDSLTDAQQRRLFGIDEPGGAGVEELSAMAEAGRFIASAEGDMGVLSRELGNVLTAIPSEGDPTTVSERVAVFSLGRIFEEARAANLDMDRMVRDAVASAADRFSDPDDAAFMLDRILRRVGSRPAAQGGGGVDRGNGGAPRIEGPDGGGRGPDTGPEAGPFGETAGIPDIIRAEQTGQTETEVELDPTRGATDSVRYVADTVIGGTVQGARKLVDLWSTPLVQVVEDSPAPLAQEVGPQARAAIDKTKKIIGEWQGPVAEFQRHVAGRTMEQQVSAYALSEPRPSLNGQYATTLFQDAVENDATLEALRPQEQRIVREYRKLIEDTGRTAEEMGVLINIDGERVPFTHTEGGRKFLRSFTPEMYEAMESGSNNPTAYAAIVGALADMNGMDEAVAMRRFDRMRERALTRAGTFEIAREFKHFPTHVRVAGSWMPVLRSDPFGAAQSMITHQAPRLGFISAFGQDESTVQNLTDEFARQGGKAQDMENLMRSLQAIPVDTPRRMFQVGSPAYNLGRWFKAMMGVQRAGLLTMSWIPNLFETMATTPATVGGRRYARALGELMIGREVDAARETARIGSRTIDILNWNFDPVLIAESISRLAQNVGVFLGQKVNELNEAINAHAGLILVRDLQHGQGTRADRMRLEMMRFTPEQVDQLMSGEASQDLYNTVVQRTAETGQGTTSLPAEKSRAANSRLYRNLIAFDSYAQKTANRTLRLGSQLAEKSRAAVAADPDGRNDEAWREAGIAAANMGKWLGGATLAGSLSMIARAIAYDGLIGAAAKVDEADEDRKGFLIEALSYTLLGGAADMLVRTAGSDRVATGVGDAASNMMPVRLLSELSDLLKSKGPYATVSGYEKWMRFQRRNVVMTRAVESWASVMGLGERDREREVAIRSYWNWRRKNTVMGRYDAVAPTDNAEEAARSEEFRLHMNTAYRAIRQNKPAEEALKALRQAVDHGDIAASIRGKKLVTKIPVRLQAKFVEDVPPHVVQQILAHDELLESWAKSLSQ